MPWNKDGSRKALYKKSGFTMKYGKHTNKAFPFKEDEIQADMDPVVVTPQMEEDRGMYNILDDKLNKNSFLEDDEARTYDGLAEKMNKK